MNEPLILLLTAGTGLGLCLWLFRPTTGLFWRWQQTRRITQRVQIEDALKHMHDCEYHGRTCTLQSIAGVLRCKQDEVAELLGEMEKRKFVEISNGTPQLTSRGRDYALHIIRAHRLWERYLADRTGFAAEDWHSLSERREHELSAYELDALAAELGHPRFDPHGDPIPTTKGDLRQGETLQSLAQAPLNQPLQIVHLEDEPETIFAQLLAEGIHLGMQIIITERTAQRIRFWGDGDDHVLAPLFANSISVTATAHIEINDQPARTLSTLAVGELATVHRLAPRCQGAERRRLLDLGILPGTTIHAEMVSPSGDPTAYRIRGTLIGLRKEQADLIQIIEGDRNADEAHGQPAESMQRQNSEVFV